MVFTAGMKQKEAAPIHSIPCSNQLMKILVERQQEDVWNTEDGSPTVLTSVFLITLIDSGRLGIYGFSAPIHNGSHSYRNIMYSRSFTRIN